MGDLHSLAMARAAARGDVASGRTDGWLNLQSGMGDPTRDRRQSACIAPTLLSWADCANLYRGDKMAAKVVDLIAAEMVREWFDVLVQDDQDRSERVEKQLKKIGAKAAFQQAITWARQFGGAGILVGANDGAKSALEPLDMKKVKSVDYLTVIDSSELLPAAWYRLPSNPKYAQPEIFRLQPRFINMPNLVSASLIAKEKQGIFDPVGGISYVHESRVLPFYGVRLSRMEMLGNLGWGDTVYNRIYSLIRDFAGAFESVALTLTEFAQGVLKMKGLAAGLAAKGAPAITQRLMGVNLSRSVARLLLLDADGEEFKREALNFGSIPEVLDRFCNQFAAAADLPVSLLMGQAPAGLNATGDSDIRWFYDHVSHMQEIDLVPQAERLVEMIFAADGGVPDNWSIECRSLWQLDEVQQADVRLKTSTADKLDVDAGIVTPEEIAVTRYGGDKYNPGKVQLAEVDPEKRALAGEEEAEAEAERKKKLQPPMPPAPAGGSVVPPPANKSGGIVEPGNEPQDDE